MRLITLLPAVLLLAVPVVARADRNPDFDDDAKPILSLQPGLLQYVESNFKVQDTGIAKYPGSDDRRPQPPFIFRAKPRGEHGPYHLMLLIQPGPVNHILNVVDTNRVHLDHPLPVASQPQPAIAQQPPQPSTTPAPHPIAATAPAPATPAQMPTADTPSGPIPANSGAQSPPATAPSLEPPPDPATNTH